MLSELQTHVVLVKPCLKALSTQPVSDPLYSLLISLPAVADEHVTTSCIYRRHSVMTQSL